MNFAFRRLYRVLCAIYSVLLWISSNLSPRARRPDMSAVVSASGIGRCARGKSRFRFRFRIPRADQPILTLYFSWERPLNSSLLLTTRSVSPCKLSFFPPEVENGNDVQYQVRNAMRCFRSRGHAWPAGHSTGYDRPCVPSVSAVPPPSCLCAYLSPQLLLAALLQRTGSTCAREMK